MAVSVGDESADAVRPERAARFHVKRRGGAPDSTDTAIRVTTRLDEVVAQTLGGMDGCTSVNAVLNAVLGVASSDRRILLDP